MIRLLGDDRYNLQSALITVPDQLFDIGILKAEAEGDESISHVNLLPGAVSNHCLITSGNPQLSN